MKRIEWNDVWQLLAILSIVTFVAFVSVALIKKKTVFQYSIGNTSNNNPGNTLSITKHVDWFIDDEIILDRSITYLEAIRLVDSLNASLK